MATPFSTNGMPSRLRGLFERPAVYSIRSRRPPMDSHRPRQSSPTRAGLAARRPCLRPLCRGGTHMFSARVLGLFALPVLLLGIGASPLRAADGLDDPGGY